MTALNSPFRRDFTAADAERLAPALRIIADPARLRIIHLLASEGPQRPTDLADALGLSPSTITHHLGVLTDAAVIVETSRSGREVWRGPDVDAVARIAAAIEPFGGGR